MNIITKMAAAIWRAEAAGVPNVSSRRTYEAFRLEAHQTQAKYEVIAREAISSDSFLRLMLIAMYEAERAMQKYPQPNYVITKVAEEAGEVVRAAVHCAEGRMDMHDLRSEMKQLVAMLYRLWVEGDGVHGLPPVRDE